MKAKPKKLIVILGPTATGKTRLAVSLARKYGGEIISADSRQVFRGMDIGTGKDLAEYGRKPLSSRNRAPGAASGRAARGSRTPKFVPYSLIDIISPKTQFNVAKYQKLAQKAIGEAHKRGSLPFLVGGTGLYIDAITKGYEFPKKSKSISEIQSIRRRLDRLSPAQLLVRLKKIDPAAFDSIDKKNRRRVQRALEIFYETGKTKSELDRQSPPDYEILTLGVRMPLDEIYRKIDSRLEARLEQGMVAEVKRLRQQGVSWKRLDEFGLEYRFVSRYLRGLISRAELSYQLRRAIHHFAKRQLTWFKRDKNIVWIEDGKQAEKAIDQFLSG